MDDLEWSDEQIDALRQQAELLPRVRAKLGRPLTPGECRVFRLTWELLCGTLKERRWPV